MRSSCQVGLLGCGTVGGELALQLLQKRGFLQIRTGCDLQLRKIAVRDRGKRRPLGISPELLTDDPESIVNDPSIEVVVELMGGIEAARKLLLKALQNGKSVVTANKALLAERGIDLFREAAARGGRIGFEASVCGGIPLLRGLTEGLVANEILSLHGIINGTSNFILSTMTEKGVPLTEALKEAQAAGFAEADPALDLEGIDTAQKLSILSMLSYGGEVPFREIMTDGIQRITPEDLRFARQLGYIVKPLAIARRHSNGLELRVHPAMIPENHPLASVRGGTNAVSIRGDLVGETLFSGPGAGGRETASAVLSDLVAVAQGGGRIPLINQKIPLLPSDGFLTEAYLRVMAVDRPGVLAEIAGILGRHRVSISAVSQKETGGEDHVPIVILTHRAPERDLQRAVKEIGSLEVVFEPPALLRLEKLIH